MTDRLASTLSLSDKDALVYQNRSQEFNKDATTFAIDPLGKIAVICGKRGLFFTRIDEEKLDIYRTMRDPKNTGKDISGVRWSRNANILASTCLQELSLWDLNSTSQTPLLSKFACHRRAITGFDWSNHQECVFATASLDAESLVYLWDSRDPGAPVKFHALRSPFGGASAVKWSRREEHFLAASNGPQLLVWDVRKESAPVFVIPADLRALVDFDWSYRDDLQLLTCAPGSVKFWSLSNPRKAVGVLQTPAIRARFNPFSRSCVTLTGQSDHSWDLWNLSDISTPYLVKEFGVDDWNGTRKGLGPLSKFNWRRVLVGSSFEYQMVTWSTKDQLFSMWRIGSDELMGCGVEPSKANKVYSKKLAEEASQLELLSSTATAASPTATLSALSDSGSDWDSNSALFATASSSSDPFGSGKIWEVISVDSTETESTSSAQSTTNGGHRSRANSSSLLPPPSTSNASSTDSFLPSPPGSFKTALARPDGHKRVPSNSGSNTRQSLPRPVSFDVELDVLMKRPMVGLILERIDKPSRMALFSLRRGKTHVEVRITFPMMYPNGAPPSFTVLTNTNVASTVKTKEILVESAGDYVSMNRNCLAPAFSQLIEYLGTQDSEVIEASAIEQSTKDVEENLTRGHRRPSLTLSSPLHHPTSLNVSSASGGLTSPRHPNSLPASGEFVEYVVKPTDSLAAIALFFNMTVGELRKLNKIQHSVQLLPGQLLLVKRLSQTPSSSSSAASSHTSSATGSPVQQAAHPNSHHTPFMAPIHANTTPLSPAFTRPHSSSGSRATIGHAPPATSGNGISIPQLPRLTGDSPSTPTKSPSETPKTTLMPGLFKTIHGLPSGVKIEDYLSSTSSSSSPSEASSSAAPASSNARSIPGSTRKGGNLDDSVAASPMVGSFLGSPSGLKSRAKMFDMVAAAPTDDVSIHTMRVKFLDRTLNPPVLVAGLLTATSSNFFFEPDLDQPAVIQRGALHYSIFLEMKKIREAVDLKSMNLSLLAHVDDEEGGVYLQILTKDRQPINHSKVLLFLCQSQAKAEETAKAMTRWTSGANERSLLDGLGLDAVVGSFVAPSSLASSATAQNANSAISGAKAGDIAPSRRHVAGDIIGSSRAGLHSSNANLRASSNLHSGLAPIGAGGAVSGLNPSKTPPASTVSLLESALSKFTLATLPKNSTSAFGPSSPVKAADAAKLLGRPPTRPAPSTTGQSGVSTSPSASPTDGANATARQLWPQKSPAVPGKVFVGSKTLPTEDPDDLPQLLGEGSTLTQDMVWALRGSLPFRYKYHDWKLLFSTSVHGTSLLTFYKHLDRKAPTILVIRDTDGHLFGGFSSQPWHISKTFFGTGESFLFSLMPNFAVYTWTGADDYYCIGNRDFLAMGGGGTSGRYGLWLDSELSAGTSEVSKTFLNRRLSLNEEFTCAVVEVYAIVPK